MGFFSKNKAAIIITILSFPLAQMLLGYVILMY
jgi:hypothetical protein